MNLYNVHQPTISTLPIVADLPHSGRFVPPDIAAQFTEEHLLGLPNCDWRLDKLYNFLPDIDVTVLEATHSRYVVDVNRRLNEPLFGSFFKAAVAEQAGFQWPIYKVKPTHEEVLQRIQQYHIPYHNRLRELLKEKTAIFGKVYLLDFHSFFWPTDDEVILGDGKGQTCSEFSTACVERHFLARGYRTMRNQPYGGRYITRHHSQLPGVEALQIEVRYHLYLRESQLDKFRPPEYTVPEFRKARQIFHEIFTSIVRDISHHKPGWQGCQKGKSLS